MGRRIVVGTLLLGSMAVASLAHAQGNPTTDEDWPAAPPPNSAPPPATTSAPPPAPVPAPPASPVTTPAAQPPPTSAQPRLPATADEAERKSLTQLGVGLGYATTWGSGARSASGVGLVLEVGKTVPLAERVDFGLRFAWGLTEWERFTRWAKAGYDAGAWTTQAYEDVYNWTRKRGEDGDLSPNTHGLRLMGSLFAFMVLSLGYVVSGLAYATAIVAPTTWLELDLTANYNFGERAEKTDKEVNPYVKGGLGFMAFIHPEYGRIVGGLGPTVGTGVRIGTLHLGANATWSPPLLHGEARTGSTHILVGGLTIGVQN